MKIQNTLEPRIRGIIGLEYTLQNLIIWHNFCVIYENVSIWPQGSILKPRLPFQFTCFYISSPEPKALVSFSDQNLSLVCVVIVVVVKGGTIHRHDRCTDAS